MSRNTLLAIIAICLTINILAGGYIYLSKEKSEAAAAPQVIAQVSSLPSGVSQGVVADSVYAQKETKATAEAEEDVQQKSHIHVMTKSAKKQDVINHLNKYLNLMPSSHAKSPEGFDHIYFSLVNKSNYTFDQVTINFRCYLPNGTLWNERDFVVGPIAPNSSVDQLVPDQLRGSRVEWKTTSIKSNDLDFTWPN